MPVSSDEDKANGAPAPVDPNANARVLLITAVCLGGGLLLASFYPVPLFQLVLQRVWEWGAAVCFGLALFKRQAPRASFLTFWDQGLILLWGATIAALFVDDAVTRDFLDQVGRGVDTNQ